MSAGTREFPTLDVVTVYTGTLVSDRGIDSVYELCGWMLDDQLMTHQLPNASRVLEPCIAEQHPWIADLEVPKGDLPALKAMCARIVEEHGDTLTLERPESPEWVAGNAMTDLRQIADGRRVIEVDLDADGTPVVTDAAVEIDILPDLSAFNRAVSAMASTSAEAAEGMRKLGEALSADPDEPEGMSA